MYEGRLFIGKGQGRRLMERRRLLHPGISPLSRYGDRVAAILPSVWPAAPAQRRWGSTDLSRLMSAIARTPGSSTTRQGISLSWSAWFPRWLDFILIALDELILDVKSLRVPPAYICKRAFPADCPHVRLILTTRLRG